MIAQQLKVLAWVTVASLGLALTSWAFVYGEAGRMLLSLIIVAECLVLLRTDVPILARLYQHAELEEPVGPSLEDLVPAEGGCRA